MSSTKANFTTVRNISGVTKFFSFLGERGVVLDNGSDVDVPGDIFSRWQNDARQTAALRYALDNGQIAILRTPAVIGWDYAVGKPWELGFASSAPVAVNPGYGSYSGTAPTG